MRTWQGEQLEAFISEDSDSRLFERVKTAALKLGFEYCAYGVRPSLPISRTRTTMFNNYPLEWRQRYTASNYLAIDPIVLHSLSSPVPLIWTDQLFAAVPNFWEEARSFGLRYGWSQPCCDAYGTLGMLTVARSHDKLTGAEIRKKCAQLSWLTQATHLAMTRILVKKMIPEIDVRLSKKEQAVIRWTAEGKTAAEISKIMSLSARTVNFHVTNVIRKLNATNKTAAVVRAAVLGLLR